MNYRAISNPKWSFESLDFLENEFVKLYYIANENDFLNCRDVFELNSSIVLLKVQVEQEPRLQKFNKQTHSFQEAVFSSSFLCSLHGSAFFTLIVERKGSAGKKRWRRQIRGDRRRWRISLIDQSNLSHYRTGHIWTANVAFQNKDR